MLNYLLGAIIMLFLFSAAYLSKSFNQRLILEFVSYFTVVVNRFA